MALRIREFDTWRPRYNSAIVRVFIAGTTTDADLFTDENLTVAAANPQTLLSLTVNNVNYGKFAAPLYTASPFYLDIDSTDQTGVERPPLTNLVGENASDAVVTTTNGSESRALDDRFDDWINALDYGALGVSAATNDTTLTAAIGAAAANGGGVVRVPAGTYPFVDLTLSAGVVLKGAGRGVTTLQCQTADNCITLSGDRAGLASLTLDGINLVASGVGVFSKANNETLFHDVEIKRFETGLHFKGGRRSDWRGLYIDNCVTGFKMHGDDDAGGGADGDDFRDNLWVGGKVQICSTIGVHMSYEDRNCWNNKFIGIGFENNTGTALDINGAQRTSWGACWWNGNTKNLAVDDDSDTDANPNNQVIGLKVDDGLMNGTTMTLAGKLQEVLFERMSFEDVDITLTLPQNSVLCRDCTEDSLVTLSGSGTSWLRQRSTDKGASSGTTTDATATVAWSVKLEPGQVAYLEAKVLGNQSNGESTAEYHISTSARKQGDELAYDAQTVNFTLGAVLTGATSGATATIVADVDGGATGTLTLRDISGVFQDNEAITGSSGGAAVANGVLSGQNAVLLGAVLQIRASREDIAGWAATFNANGDNIEVLVTGAAATDIEWLCDVVATLT